MKKQSSGDHVNRQDLSTVTPFPGDSLTGSKPHGVHARDRGKPTHISAGAAESTTKPVELPGRGSRSTGSGAGSTKSRTHS